MSIDAEFAGLRAVVTGGGSGIGAATAELLLSRGCTVAVLDLEPSGAPAGAVGLVCDVTSTASVEQAVAAAVEHLGGLDIVVNNAGIGAQGGVEANDDAEWARVLDLNVVGMVRVARAALPYLKASEHGVIVNTSSVVATVGVPDRVLYSASKGAVLAMTRAMAADLVHDGVRVNCVSPGTADTPWIGRLLERTADPAAERAALQARQPHGRLVTPAEIAGAIAYLASPLNASTNGVSLAVDGGMDSLRTRPRP